MCDYSLHGIKNRLANEGEQLFVHKFHTGSKGLASVQDLKTIERPSPAPAGASVWARIKCWFDNKRVWISEDLTKSLPAVCIPPGARLQLNAIPVGLQKQYGVGAREEVTFVQLSAEPFRYRDAIRFNNGQEVLLQKLTDGLRVDVLCLSLVEETVEPKHVATTYAREYVNVG
jgi:hypothetical protein